MMISRVLLFIIVACCVAAIAVQQLVGLPSVLTASHAVNGDQSKARLILTHANLLTMEDIDQPERVLENMALIIENGVIVKRLPMASLDESMTGQRIDVAGRFLAPGLIDAHIHIHDEAELAGYLSYGVTGLRNMSGYPFHLSLAEQIAKQEILGPELITTSPILNSDGRNTNINQVLVNDASQAINAVEGFYADGFRRLKIYSNLNKTSMDTAVATAKQLNMPITGHSPEGHRDDKIPYEKPFTIPWQDSVGQGFQTLEHIETVVWHALRDDLKKDKLQTVADSLLAGGDVVVPTLIAHRRLVNIAESQGAYLKQAGAETINPLLTWFEEASITYWSSMDPSRYERPHADFFLFATGYLHKRGVPLIAGSDAGGFGLVPGLSLHEELALLVESGLSPAQAIASATRLSASTLDMQQQGQIVAGARANLIMVNSDPRQDIEALKNIDGIAINGHWLDQQAIEDLQHAARDTSWLRSIWRALKMVWYVKQF